MFYIPLIIMLAVTLTSLVLTMFQKAMAIAGGADIFAPAVQFIIAAVLFVLAIVLAAKGCKVIFGHKKKSVAE